jgi:hypothetical protein
VAPPLSMDDLSRPARASIVCQGSLDCFGTQADAILGGRCRRRTWRSCGFIEASGRGDLNALMAALDPWSSGRRWSLTRITRFTEDTMTCGRAWSNGLRRFPTCVGRPSAFSM